MDWHRCQTCEMSHPWRVPEEKPCPNAAIVARTGLKGLEALKASGLFDRFDKPTAVNSSTPVNKAPVNIEPVNAGLRTVRKMRIVPTVEAARQR
jgi:hypothetical protein